MKLINTSDFLSSIKDLIQRSVKTELKNYPYPSLFVRFGTVTDITNGVQVQFDSEDSATGRKYPYLSSYTPTIGDRVMLVKGGNTWIIQGKVIS